MSEMNSRNKKNLKNEVLLKVLYSSPLLFPVVSLLVFARIF